VKYAARDDLALNFGEPVFHLVEPGGIGWGVVDAEVGISLTYLFPERIALGKGGAWFDFSGYTLEAQAGG
jgi:hypothetical protein